MTHALNPVLDLISSDVNDFNIMWSLKCQASPSVTANKQSSTMCENFITIQSVPPKIFQQIASGHGKTFPICHQMPLNFIMIA
jgi:hypothetical protein